jgi:hypothetical protein
MPGCGHLDQIRVAKPETTQGSACAWEPAGSFGASAGHAASAPAPHLAVGAGQLTGRSSPSKDARIAALASSVGSVATSSELAGSGVPWKPPAN